MSHGLITEEGLDELRDRIGRRLGAQVRRFNVVGDVTHCRGAVTAKYVEGDDRLVDCELQAVNQRGEITARGVATAVLPVS